MKKSKIFFRSLLLWLYRSPKELTPLDVPAKTVQILSIAGFLLALGLSNIFLPILYRMAEKQLQEEAIPLYLEDDRSTVEIVSALVSEEDVLKLPPDWSTYPFNESIQAYAVDNQISSEEVRDFLAKVFKEPIFIDQLIIGSFKRPLGIAQSLSAAPASKILVGGSFRRPNSLKPGRYEIGEAEDPKDNPELNYLIAQGMITKFREQMGNTYASPRRLLMALAGPIQFITFFLALWGLTTILLRWFWSTSIQTQLIRKGKLWEGEAGDIWTFWKDNSIDHPIMSSLMKKYRLALTAVRLIFDAVKTKAENTNLSADEFVNAQVDSMQTDVKNNEYHILGWIIFALPQIGLLGTILGIIETMANVPDILKSSGANSMIEAFEKVGGSLALAFDTTFVALFWVLVLGYGRAVLEKTEGNTFQELKSSSKPYIRQLWKQ